MAAGLNENDPQWRIVKALENRLTEEEAVRMPSEEPRWPGREPAPLVYYRRLRRHDGTILAYAASCAPPGDNWWEVGDGS